MSKLFTVVLLIVVCMSVGKILTDEKILVHPAYIVLWGYLFGSVAGFIMAGFK